MGGGKGERNGVNQILIKRAKYSMFKSANEEDTITNVPDSACAKSTRMEKNPRDHDKRRNHGSYQTTGDTSSLSAATKETATNSAETTKNNADTTTKTAETTI